MITKKSTGNFEILESGNVITYEEKSDLSFDIEMNKDFKFSLLIKFSTDEKKNHKITAHTLNSTITLVCTNFDNAFGTGLTKPVELATFNNKKVFFMFWVRRLAGNGPKEISYTFYIER